MKVATILLPALFLGLTAFAAPPKPNVLLIVSDDQGYADVGFHGCTDIPTPHLDRLAREGVRFSNGYVSHPFCSPSRAGLLTGRYQQRFGHEQNPWFDVLDHREGLPTTEKLLPEFLRAAGYVTGWIGKWHLGAATEFRPHNRGFMETFGFLGGGHHYWNWKVETNTEYNLPIARDGQSVPVTNHLTSAFGEEAAAYVRRHRDAPWFLYLAFNAPHTPHEPTPERLARFKSIPDPTRRKYAAQVSLLDDAIGTVIAALRESGQENRTLVFFLSDNGGPVGEKGNGSSNQPFRAGKGTVYEGGIRVPFVARWPGKLTAGRTYDLPISTLDIFPTALALAGMPVPNNTIYDGVDLMPFLTGGKSNAPHDRLFWRIGGGSQLAVREASAKLVRQRGKPPEFYDLTTDPAEISVLSQSRTNELEKLEAAVKDWNKQLVPPAFPGLAGRSKSSVER
jgi:arylsulfatase A-like enzyme